MFKLKVILASVYTTLYTDDKYLLNFYKYILDTIDNITNAKVDRENIIVILPGGRNITLHSINWVLNKEARTKSQISKIDRQSEKIDSEFLILGLC